MNWNESLLTFDLQIWLLAFYVCLTFTITIGVFPAITADIKSTLADGAPWGEFRPTLLLFCLRFQKRGRSL